MKNVVRNKLTTAIALGFCVGYSGLSSAEQSAEAAMQDAGTGARTMTIAYSSAELATDSGLAGLQRRIKQAAREVCGPVGLRETGSLSISSRNRKCYRQAVDAALSQVGSSQVASAGDQ